MIKTDYIVRAKAFIRALNKYLDQDRITDYQYIHMMVNVFNIAKHRKVMVVKGSSRLALITADYCIKIDYRKTTIWGNCETELSAYQWAVENDMEEIFCPVIKYNYLGIDYYIYPRCTRVNDEAINLYYLRGRIELKKYCLVQDYFDDLHSNNIGMLHGKPVIIDYACNYVHN